MSINTLAENCVFTAKNGLHFFEFNISMKFSFLWDPEGPFKTGMSNLFLQRASYKFKNVAWAAYEKLMIIQTLNDELKLSLY